MMTNDATAYQLSDTPGGARGRYVRVPFSELGEGNALVRVTHSSVNYKDGPAATGRALIARSLPVVGGCCAIGVVVEPGESGPAVGAPVSIVGVTLSGQHSGGYCEYLRVPSAWLILVSSWFLLLEVAATRMTGIMTAMAVLKLGDVGLTPGAGPAAVTGASGGAGSITTAPLVVRGYEVTVFTGWRGAEDYSVSFGAARVKLRPDTSGKRLSEKGLWAGAIDAVGGDTLARFTRTAASGAPIVAFGNASGNALNAMMFPFILRGVNLLEVTITFSSDDVRKYTWQILTDSLKTEALRAITLEIVFDELESLLSWIIEEGVRGRVAVQVSEEDTPQSP